MLTLTDLAAKVEAYRTGSLSVGDLEAWFESVSTGAVYDNPKLRGTCAAIDMAFAEYHFDRTGQETLKADLAAALGTFDSSKQTPDRIVASEKVSV